jgi:hypothetical protein
MNKCSRFFGFSEQMKIAFEFSRLDRPKNCARAFVSYFILYIEHTIRAILFIFVFKAEMSQ